MKISLSAFIDDHLQISCLCSLCIPPTITTSLDAGRGKLDGSCHGALLSQYESVEGLYKPPKSFAIRVIGKEEEATVSSECSVLD